MGYHGDHEGPGSCRRGVVGAQRNLVVPRQPCRGSPPWGPNDGQWFRLAGCLAVC
jgi:hypothetical protein